MSIRKLKIIGVVVAFFLCFPFHFIYDRFPSFVTSIFAPVNESIWEHMKILFGSIILSGVIQKIIVVSKRLEFNNICFSNFVGAISSIPIFLIIFLPIYYNFGHNLVITIIIMFITIVISEYIAYKVMMMKDLYQENKTILYVVIVYIIFTILTYFPINNNLFIDPITGILGIK
jgi:hypothetical protein